MNRREFLAAAAAVPVAASIVRPAPVSGRTLRKAVMFGMIGEGASVAEKFGILRDCGFEGVEMDSPSPLDPGEILAARDATGIVVHGLVDSVHWRLPLSAPDAAVRAEAVEALRTALRDAARYGSTSVLLVPAVVNADMPYDDAYRRSQEEIRKALPLAEELGVVIAIENVWNNFLLSPLEAAGYVDEFKSPMVRWHLDIGNAVHYGWPEQWARILGQRIVKLHIKDFSRRRCNEEGLWKGFDVELGEGDAGWASVMRALDETGYATAPGGNWATAEVRGGDRERLRRISEQMDAIFRL